MEFRSKVPGLNHPVLPLEFIPRIANVCGEDCPKHYLVPGKVFATAEAVAVTAIVGSTVALCLYDRVHRIGGASHFVLPYAPEEDARSTRYASAANVALLSELLGLGADIKNLEGRIFGGSEPSITFGNSEECLGTRNVKAAILFLERNGIPLASRHVGGSRGRKFVFQTCDGQAWSQEL